ncbi:DUF7344 domain-containing protein [Natrinema halophilum]|uniref:DUF7344 domain-containing protein n=1 Tax=Natrinema halophilum TaxID=1699371 RepID=UPI001F1F55F3|nr:hypothetical protein [Natrinema halophilum]UHQ96342.1 hypothetical protein HYG82_22040 [Natrinema halophilum]
MSDDEPSTRRDDTNCQYKESKIKKPVRNGGGRIKLDALLYTISSQNRRYLLYILRERKSSDVESLARQITALKQEKAPAKVSDQRVSSLRSKLHHSDIRKLEEANLAEYDPCSGVVVYSDCPPLLDSFLDLCAKVDDLSDHI